jgi:hypothetical protein
VNPPIGEKIVRHLHWLASVVALGGVAQGLAADAMKPGEYEYTVRMEMPGMPVAMPAQTSRQCVTQAEVEGGRQFGIRQDPDCQVKNLKHGAGKASFDVACGNGTTGRAEYTYDGNGMNGKTTMNMDGNRMVVHLSARRLGDCPR